MKNKTLLICLTALFTALTFVITRFIQIPIPLGYLNIGNSIILLSCLLLPLQSGLIVGSIGSAIADLTSYPVYTIPTLIIKFIMPLLFYIIVSHNKTYVRCVVAVLVSTLVPLFGYTLTGCILYGGFAAGIAQFPGLVVEYVLNAAIFAAFFKPVKAAGKTIPLQ